MSTAVNNLPAALRKHVNYNGKIISNKEYIDLLIKDGYNTIQTKPTTTSRPTIMLCKGSNKTNCFRTKAEIVYIYNALGQPLPQANAGAIIQGPDHNHGGVLIVQEKTGKPLIEAKGNEIIMNETASRTHCEELSAINEKTGGIKFDCKDGFDKAEKGSQLQQGIKVEQEHRDLYLRLQADLAKQGIAMPITEHEFYKTIAQKHIDEKQDYYTLLAKFVEGEVAAKGAQLCATGTMVQTLIFNKSIYADRADARKWADKHNFESGYVDEKQSTYHFRQHDPHQFKPDSFRTITLANGVQAVIGCPIHTHMNTADKGANLNDGPPYYGAAASKQIKRELTAAFPGIKFSVRYESFASGDAIRIGWNFGPTTKQVEAIADKYEYGRFDAMTDSSSIEKTSVVTTTGEVKDLGGAKYVTTRRDKVMANGVESWDDENHMAYKIAKALAEKQHMPWQGMNTPFYGNSTNRNDSCGEIALRVISENSFDTDVVTTFDGIENKYKDGNSIESLYVIKYNGDKVTHNAMGEEEKLRHDEYERTRPEREAKQKADNEAYEKAVADRKMAIANLQFKAYPVIADVFIKNAQWPSLNKNETLDQYKKYWQQDIADKKDITQQAKVEQVVIVDDENFKVISNNLMSNLSNVWNKVGGNGIDDAVLLANGISADDWAIGNITKEQREKLWPHVYTACTLVFNSKTKESFLADVSGYDYARYVGFAPDFAEVENALLNIKVDEQTANALKDEDAPPQPEGPFNILKPTKWDLLPQTWRVVKPLPAIAFDNSPYDKNLIKLVTPFVNTDPLRPVLASINFDDNGIVVTDAHKLIHLPLPNKQFKGAYCTVPTCKKIVGETKDDKVDAKFPDYARVIPESVAHVYKISVLKLKAYAQAIVLGTYANSVTHQIILTGANDKDGVPQAIGVNAKFLIDVLNTCLLLGHDQVYISTPPVTKAFVFAFDEATAKAPQAHIGKSTILLLMQVEVREPAANANGMYTGAMDLDWNKEFKIAYNLADDNIYNNNGSVAGFDFKLLKATETDLTDQQDKMVLAYLPKGYTAIPIIETVAITNGQLQVTDLECQLILKNISKPNNTYYYNNDALVNAEMELDEFPPLPDIKEFKHIGSINRLEFLFNLEKAMLCVGKDVLRPVMSGVHLLKTKTDDRLIIEATNAHVLFRNQIQNEGLKEVDIDIPQPKKLRVFLQNVFDDVIDVHVSGTNVMFSAGTSAAVIHRLIDGKYPNTPSVIPINFEQVFTLDITDLKQCIKTLTRDESKDDHTLAFTHIAGGKIKIDVLKIGQKSSVGEHDFIRELCQVTASAKPAASKGSDLAFLGMPKLLSDTEKYLFGVAPNILETFIKITESDELIINYTAPNRALVLNDSEFKHIAQAANIPAPAAKPKPKKDVLEQTAELQDKVGEENKKAAADKKQKADRAKQLKIAKAKAAAQAQRLRIFKLK